MTIERKGLTDIAEKVARGERLTREEGVRLYESHDLVAIGQMANRVRERLHGKQVFFNKNRHINPTNICAVHCNFCSFRRNGNEADAYWWTAEQIVARVRPDVDENTTEFHIVGGLHPELGVEYYNSIFRALKQAFPWIHLKGMTAVEIHYLAQLENKSWEEVVESMHAAGLDSLPGGGAEIFAEHVRRRICPEKSTADEWLAIHRIAHNLGMRSNATMLYGHIEDAAARVDHMIRLRELQDETGGFQTFIPLAFHPMNNGLGKKVDREWTTGVDDLKTLAIARLMLDNFAHIKAYWIMLTPGIAQVALRFGADDIDGTVIEEKIYHDAGATTAQGMTRRELMRYIRAVGCTPVERDTLYNV
ncbi:MAG: aminofutalosine synthase MqnE, partial [Ardenticatenales bacterium]|nr:aminofutalosine synthase MqnE [Ardenticatenales bacterium]